MAPDVEGEPSRAEIPQMLAEHEEAMGGLYRLFAERFDGQRDFWSKLADEEREHAEWIRRLCVRVREGLGCVRPDKFDSASARKSLGLIDKLKERASQPEFSASDALCAALKMEKMLLEAEYFDVFEGTAAEVTQVQYCLSEAIKDHRDRIEKAIGAHG